MRMKPTVTEDQPASQAPNQNPVSVAPSTETEALPPLPPLKEDDPSGCSDYFGEDWTQRIQPTLQNYLAFPSEEPTDDKLSRLEGRLTAEFFEQTAEAWRNSTDPRSWVTDVNIDTCQLEEQRDGVQPVLFGAFLTIKDADGNVSPVYFSYDTFLVRQGNQFVIVSVTPSGAVADEGG
jgi:hypothetical protein